MYYYTNRGDRDPMSKSMKAGCVLGGGGSGRALSSHPLLGPVQRRFSLWAPLAPPTLPRLSGGGVKSQALPPYYTTLVVANYRRPLPRLPELKYGEFWVGSPEIVNCN